MIEPRFGVWAPVYGPWGARHHPGETSQTSYVFARDIVIEAERLGFKVVMIAQHIINPLNNDYHQLETWSAAAAFAEATERIELIAAVKPFFFHPAILADGARHRRDQSRTFVDQPHKRMVHARDGTGGPDYPCSR